MLKSKASLIGKLNADHQIITTWVLNPELSQIQVDLLIQQIVLYSFIVKKDSNHHLKVSGTTSILGKLFRIDFLKYKVENNEYYGPNSDIIIPLMWKNKVLHVLGFDNFEIVHPYVKVLDHIPRGTSTFTPLQLARLYNFPTGLDGTGQKIGVIELGGGYNMSDFTTYFSMLGIQGIPRVTSVSVDGAQNNPNDPSVGANLEVILDVEIIAAIVPKADIIVYFGINSYQGFYNAINKAIIDNCNIISISWGAPEINWSTSMLNAYNNLFQTDANRNITILAASGDNGSSDGTNTLSVDFPSSAPYALGCGGTNLKANNDVTAIAQETVWNVNPINSATGGGISKTFAKPSYQNNVVYNLGEKRGVPDVCGDADPFSGYVIFAQGKTAIVGGTSAVSPLWTGLLSKVNQSLGRNVGFIHPILYANPNVCRDILQGNNGAYSAALKWDPCTGMGSPNGQLLLNLLSSGGNNNPPVIPSPVANFTSNVVSGNKPLTVNFTDISTNSESWLWEFGDNT
ncbi:MAG: S8 family serine peptidase, partial [Nitrososphaeraceae archaeon]|nr:S8 family serine peptidase [Nitrososphaeraceae archaeon]